MDKMCEVVQDLMPLYVDEICSPASAELVEKHLGECEQCRHMMGRMQNSAWTDTLVTEKNSVIEKQAKRFRRTSALVGAVIAGIMMIPVMICLIVNLATGHGLSWFFIVLVALMLAASLIVVPLMVPDYKAMWTLICGTGSLMLLLAVCCIYTGGTWFFIAACATLFGIALVFGPFAVRSRLIRDYVKNQKALIYFAAITVLFFLMMIVIGIYVGSGYPWGSVAMITLPLWAIVWGVFSILRYVPLKKIARFGIASMAFGIMFMVCDVLIYAAEEMAMGYNRGLSIPSFFSGEWIVTGVCVIVGVVLLLIGLKKGDL